MLKKPLESLLIFIGVLVVVGFGLSIWQVATTPSPSSQPENTDTSIGETPLLITRDYFAGANAYHGTVIATKPCQRLSTDVEFSDSFPEQIKIILDTNQIDENCRVGSVKKDFTFVIPSSEQARLMGVELNGKLVSFELKEN